MSSKVNLRECGCHDCTRSEKKLDIREALGLAFYVEDMILERPVRKLSGGWIYQELIADGDNMQMFVFARMKDTRMEYALVNKGTDFCAPSDYWNDIAQLFGLSKDMGASINCARAFVERHEDSVITFIGHSKGGAEAAANAITTNRNAIVLNPMRLMLTREMSECLAGYRGMVDVFAVRKDPVKMLFGWTQGIPGMYLLLPSLTATPHRLNAIECGLIQAGIWNGTARAGMV